jgi:hypothetical protein
MVTPCCSRSRSPSVRRGLEPALGFLECVEDSRTSTAWGLQKFQIQCRFLQISLRLFLCQPFRNSEHRRVGMFDAQKVCMLLKPENRALRALLWLVIILVPGGLLLLGLLAADTLHRRHRDAPRLSEADLADAPLSSLNSSRGRDGTRSLQPGVGPASVPR